MTNWNDKSDFEVNKRLAELLGLVLHDKPKKSKLQELIGKPKDSEIFACHGDFCWTIDYCNNWADIGPLIEKFNITLNQQDGCMCEAFSRDYIGRAQYGTEHGNNVKRAAAICIIKLLESKQ